MKPHSVSEREHGVDDLIDEFDEKVKVQEEVEDDLEKAEDDEQYEKTNS